MNTLRVVLAVVTILVAGAKSGIAALQVINVQNFSFSKAGGGSANLSIMQGDQIKWQWIAGSSTHTTTSGTPPTPSGLWNDTLRSSAPSFTRTFNTVGNFPFFCRIHNSMKGSISVESAAGVLDDPSSPDSDLPNLIALRQNSPNPFNAATEIEYSTEADGRVQLSVYNILGQRVAILADGFLVGGAHRVTWDGRNDRGDDAPSGIYFARMMTETAVMTRKMVLLR